MPNLQMDCRNAAKGCVPMDLYTLGVFQGLQRMINDYAAKTNHPDWRVSVDGRIGPLTLAAAQKIVKEPWAATAKIGVPADFKHLSRYAFDYARAIGISLGTTPNFTPDPAATDYPIPPPGAVAEVIPDEPSAMIAEPTPSRAWLWWVLGAVGVLGAGLAGWAIYRSSKGQPVFGALPPASEADATEEDIPEEYRSYIDV